MPGLDLGIQLKKPSFVREMDCRVKPGNDEGESTSRTAGFMPADLAFWYELLLKMAMTATIVVAASVAVERSGPFLGALIAALPTAAGAAYIILALEHAPSFISASAVGSLAANAAVAVFALCYAALAQRHGIVLSITAAAMVWLATAATLRLIDWSPLAALALNSAVFAVTIPASAPYRSAAIPRKNFKRTAFDLPVRAATAALVVAVVTTASYRIGSFASGMFAVFPIVMGTTAVILHPRVGGPTTGALFAHAQPALFGLGLGFLGVHYLAEVIGVWWAYAAGLGITVAWSGLLWLFRHWRK
jgi:hypothetical protein